MGNEVRVRTPISDVVVVGGTSTDFVAKASRLPRPGETICADAFLEGPGGKGATQAVAAARLGARVFLISAVGNDRRGRTLVGQLDRESIRTTYILEKGRADTGASVIHVDKAGEKQIVSVLGANRFLTAVDVERACGRIERARVVLAQLEVPVEAVTAAFKWARAIGAKTILDPAPPVSLQNSVLAMVDVIKPNAEEAKALTGLPVRDRATARRAAQMLLDRGVGAVAIQAGLEGSLLVWRDGEHFFSRIAIDSVDATGAGDAFTGALAAALAREKSLVDAVMFANGAAALATTKLGAQAGLPKEAQLKEFVSRTTTDETDETPTEELQAN
jgi:ribokinase